MSLTCPTCHQVDPCPSLLHRFQRALFLLIDGSTAQLGGDGGDDE